jgi:adenylate kinase
MAPTDSSVVDELKNIITKLESRVEELEHKISGKDGSPGSSDSMRMILMGPPGAGTVASCSNSMRPSG